MSKVKSSNYLGLSERPLDLLYFGFFTSHIIFTIICDCMVLFPISVVPSFLLKFNQFIVHFLKDPFMNVYDHQYSGEFGAKYFYLMWFRTFVLLELCFQLPFFFYAVKLLVKDQKHLLKIPGIIYSSHVATTVAPLLMTIIFGLPTHSLQERVILFSVYSPYLFIPLVFLYDLLTLETPKKKTN